MMNNDSIQSMGGKARDAALSDEQKREIAKKAAAVRWGERPILATHKGSFREEFGTDVECYVLNDSQKTAVISQSGMGSALGLSHRGNAFPRFLESKAIKNVVGAQLREKLSKPLKFQWGGGGAQKPQNVIHGFDAAILIDVCRAIIDAEPKLNRQQRHIAAQAHVILGASAKSGIRGLVYALAGYNPTAQEVVAAFKLYVQDEAKKYEKEFPNELYLQWHRLYDLPVPVRGKPWTFKHLTVNHIYYPLAKSSGKILELIRLNKTSDGSRSKKLFQFLNELGARALRIQLGRVLEMAESSAGKAAYEQKINERFGSQKELALELPEPKESALSSADAAEAEKTD